MLCSKFSKSIFLEGKTEKSRSSEYLGKKNKNLSDVPPKKATFKKAPLSCKICNIRACKYSRITLRPRRVLGCSLVSCFKYSLMFYSSNNFIIFSAALLIFGVLNLFAKSLRIPVLILSVFCMRNSWRYSILSDCGVR